MTTANDLPVLELLPAVDVVDGQAVRLVQGGRAARQATAPAGSRPRLAAAGAEWIHLVDLDAAFGRGSNPELLRQSWGKLDMQGRMSGGTAGR